MQAGAGWKPFHVSAILVLQRARARTFYSGTKATGAVDFLSTWPLYSPEDLMKQHGSVHLKCELAAIESKTA